VVIEGQHKVKVVSLDFWNTDFLVYMDDHLQATAVLFPYSPATQGFMKATMGITVCFFLCLFVFLLH